MPKVKYSKQVVFVLDAVNAQQGALTLWRTRNTIDSKEYFAIRRILTKAHRELLKITHK